MPAIHAELQSYLHVRSLLRTAIAELRAHFGDDRTGMPCEADFQRTFSRVSRFFDGLREVAFRGRRAPASEGRLAQFRCETETLLRASDAGTGERLLAWGLVFREDTGWEVDFLAVDYHLRSFGAHALALLERYAALCLEPFVTRWSEREAVVLILPAPAAPAPTRSVPPTRLRIDAHQGGRHGAAVYA